MNYESRAFQQHTTRRIEALEQLVENLQTALGAQVGVVADLRDQIAPVSLVDMAVVNAESRGNGSPVVRTARGAPLGILG